MPGILTQTKQYNNSHERAHTQVVTVSEDHIIDVSLKSITSDTVQL